MLINRLISEAKRIAKQDNPVLPEKKRLIAYYLQLHTRKKVNTYDIDETDLENRFEVACKYFRDEDN